MKAFIKLSRPKQWVKNVLIFSVPVLSFEFWAENHEAYINLALVFIATILVSTSVYAFNDISDAELDAKHPTKKTRPVASGEIKVKTAYFFSSTVAVSGLVLGYMSTGGAGFYLLLLYLILNILYSFKLKNLPYVEMLIVVYGYPLRVALGALAVSSVMTNIFITIVVFLSAAIVFAKRLSQKKSNHGVSRRVVEKYSSNFLKKGIIVALFTAWGLLIYWTISKVLEVETVLTPLLASASTIAIVSSAVPLLHIFREATTGRLEKPEIIVRNPTVLFSGFVFIFSFLAILSWAL